MRRIDLSRGLWPLAWPVTRANLQVMAVGALLLTASSFFSDFHPPSSEAVSIWLTATWVAEFVVLLLVEISLAFALLPTLLSGGVLSGQAALRAAKLPRMAVYLGYSVLMVLLSLVMTIAVAMLLGGLREPDTPTFAVSYTCAYFLGLLFFGLMGPDIVAQGRFAPGMALRWAWGRFWTLAGLLLAGAVPLVVVATWLGAEADVEYGRVTDLTRPELARHVGLAFAGSVVSVLSSVLAFTALAKVYVEVAPPDEQLDNARVATVFE